MSANPAPPTPPVAQVGDICLIVEPDAAERARLRDLQEGLREQFGGQPQERIHFTCQRFRPENDDHLAEILSHLRSGLRTITPVSIAAGRVEQVDHPFFGVCVVRWQLDVNDDLYQFQKVVESALRSGGAPPHYPSHRDHWRPHVTALVSVPNAQIPFYFDGATAPRYLFTGRKLTLSQVQPGKQFQILAEIGVGA